MVVMDTLDSKLNEFYAGKVVRKDLTKSIKEGANVPSYVLEYLLGMYCATDNEEDIERGVAMVKQVLGNNFVRPDEAEKIKSKIRERGQYKIIDKVSAQLNERNDCYERQILNINISNNIFIFYSLYTRNAFYFKIFKSNFYAFFLSLG